MRTSLAIHRAVALVALVLVSATTLVGASSTAVAAEPGFNPYGAQGSVYRLYRAAFLREPSTEGFRYWEETHANGFPMDAIAQSFVDSEEFRDRYQDLDDRAFIRLVYGNVLEREPDEGGYEHWTTAMDNGMSRGELLLAFSESDEFVAKTYEGHPPGYEWLDPFEVPGNFVSHDGTVPPAHPRCTGLLSLCLGDHIDLAYGRLGPPEYDVGGYYQNGYYQPRSVGWRIGKASVSIDFDPNGRASAFSAMLMQGSTVVAVSSFHTLGVTTVDEVRNYKTPVYEVQYSEDCSYETYGYRDNRSSAEGMGERFIRIGTRDCPFFPEESWYPVVHSVTIDARSL